MRVMVSLITDTIRGHGTNSGNWGPNIGLTLGFNIFDGFNRKREQKNARITMENRQLELDRLKLSLQSDFRICWMVLQKQYSAYSVRRGKPPECPSQLRNCDGSIQAWRLVGNFIARSAKQFARGRATIADCQIPN